MIAIACLRCKSVDVSVRFAYIVCADCGHTEFVDSKTGGLMAEQEKLGFDEYQRMARETAIYPGKVTYPALGLNGEAGEVAEKVKKVLRDQDGHFNDESKKAIKKEIGDCLWYLANLAEDLEISLESAARDNYEKLKSRQARGKIQGSGDNR